MPVVSTRVTRTARFHFERDLTLVDKFSMTSMC